MVTRKVKGKGKQRGDTGLTEIGSLSAAGPSPAESMTKKGVRAKAMARRDIRPPAVLIKVAEGSYYTDTVRAVRMSRGLNPEEVGAKVTGL